MIFITGATGFVGSAVLRKLIERGHEVRAMVRPASDRRNLDGLSVEVVEGDLTEPAISAASILAKTVRDALMKEMDLAFPAYGFARHKGYGTAAHAEALMAHGPCAHHRMSFAPVKRALAASA